MEQASLTGKIVLITGGSHGLGRAVAKHFVEQGAQVVICGRDSTALNSTDEELGLSKLVISSIQCDVSNEQQVTRLVDRVIKQFGRIDILVCCAGVYGPIGPVEDTDWNGWVQAVQVNLFGTVLCCREVIPIMRKQHSGKIIALSGGGATKPLPHFSAYAVSKVGVVRFIETLAHELKNTGIDCNSVAPGALNTRLVDNVFDAGPERAGAVMYALAQQTRNNDHSLQNAVDLIAFLASEKSNGITGKLISAVWDNWRTEISTDDNMYTLRRTS